MQIHLGNKIKQLRLQKGITQEILAKTLNVSCQTISKWETETSMPDIQLLPEIAVYFGCSLDELFDLSEQAQFERIENMLLMQESLSAEDFQQTKTFLLEKLHGKEKRKDPLRLLASLFNHKADEFRKTAEFYAKQALELDPECKKITAICCVRRKGHTLTGISTTTANVLHTINSLYVKILLI